MKNGCMKLMIMSALIGALICSTGCSSILGTLLAPESVVGGAATSLAESGAKALSGASLSELTNSDSTLAELDRIIQDNPNAVNTDRLRSLRDQMSKSAPANSGAEQNKKNNDDAPRRNYKTLLPNRKDDHLGLSPEAQNITRRSNNKPDTIPMGSAFHEKGTPTYFMQFNPIRIYE
jgi:hypothetical protein